MVIEMFFSLFAPLPFIWNASFTETYEDQDATIRLRYNDILLCMVCFFRIYHLGRCLLTQSQFMNTRSQRVCLMSGTDASYMFSLKSLMKKKPYLVLLFALLVSVGLLSFTLRIFERPIGTAAG